MKNLFSPNNIEVLLHCHTSARPHERIDAPAVQSVINELLKEGAIYWHAGDPSNMWRTTEKGRAWVAALCAVPPPIQAWKDGATGKIIEIFP